MRVLRQALEEDAGPYSEKVIVPPVGGMLGHKGYPSSRLNMCQIARLDELACTIAEPYSPAKFRCIIFQ